MAHLRRVPRAVSITAALMAAAVLLAAGRAQALFGVADTGDALLAQMIANGLQQLARLNETLQVARGTYDQGQRIVGYAEDAQALTASFQRFNAQRFGDHLRRDLDSAYPDAMRYRDQMEAGRWSQGGRLAPYLRYCLNGTLRKNGSGELDFDSNKLCTQVREELGSSQISAALSDTFGAVPAEAAHSAKGREAAVVDAEVAAQLSAHTSQWNRTQRVKQLVEQWQADCANTSDGKGPSAVCEAAARRAQMDTLAEQAETNRLLAEQTRVLALQLEQRNSELKREMGDALVRRAALVDGAKGIAEERITIRTERSGS